MTLTARSDSGRRITFEGFQHGVNNVAFLRHMVTSLAHQQGSGVMQVPTDYDYSKARTAANPNPNPAPNPGPNSNPSPTPTPTPNPLYKATCENYR